MGRDRRALRNHHRNGQPVAHLSLVASPPVGRAAKTSGMPNRVLLAACPGFMSHQRLARISAEVSTLLTSLTFPATSLRWSMASWLARLPVSATTP
jgi:hypothetical protein